MQRLINAAYYIAMVLLTGFGTQYAFGIADLPPPHPPMIIFPEEDAITNENTFTIPSIQRLNSTDKTLSSIMVNFTVDSRISVNYDDNGEILTIVIEPRESQLKEFDVKNEESEEEESGSSGGESGSENDNSNDSNDDTPTDGGEDTQFGGDTFFGTPEPEPQPEPQPDPPTAEVENSSYRVPPLPLLSPVPTPTDYCYEPWIPLLSDPTVCEDIGYYD